MISETDKSRIIEVSRKYGVKRILLFGSSATGKEEPRDIDLAVEGLAPSAFFLFYGELITGLSKPVDLVPLDGKSRFESLIQREGLPLYG